MFAQGEKPVLHFFFFVFVAWLANTASAQTEDEFDGDDVIELKAGNSEIMSEMVDHDQQKLYSLDLNKTSFSDLGKIPLISETNLEKIWDYLQNHRPLVSVYELQSIEGLDLNNFRIILPYISVDGFSAKPFRLRDLSDATDRSAVIRWSRNYPLERNFLLPDTVRSAYLGSPDKVFLRLRYSLPGKYSFGILAEKDAGEDWFNKQTIQGIDYITAHFAIDQPIKPVNKLIVGDYTMSLGQGLIIDNAFSIRRSFQFGLMVRQNQILRPYQSVQENQMHRGFATKWALGKQWSGIMFYSANRLDANVIGRDLSEDGSELLLISSIQLGGLHRSRIELEDRDVLSIQHSGLNVQFSEKNFSVGINAVYSDQNAKRKPTYPLPNSVGQLRNNQIAGSVYHQYAATRYTLYGEAAYFQGGSIALLQGVLFNLSKHVEGILQFRRLPADMRFALSRTTVINEFKGNEQGYLFGMQIRPLKKISVGIFAEQFKRPWITYRIPFPTFQNNYTARVQYTIRKQWSAYIQYRYAVDQLRRTNPELPKESAPYKSTDQQWRFNFESKIDDSWSWRSRLELHTFREFRSNRASYALALDFIYKSMESPISGNIRFAIFDANQFNLRIYLYENDVLHSYSFPFLLGRGIRSYVCIRYRPVKNITIESKIGCQYLYPESYNRTYLTNSKSAYQSDVKLQLQYKF